MAYEFLKKLFGTPKDGEEPKAMTYAEPVSYTHLTLPTNSRG